MENQKTVESYERPILGILVTEQRIKMLHQQKRFENFFKYEETEKAKKIANITIYYCCIKDIFPRKKLVLGTFFNEKNKVKRKLFPFPDVLYDRTGGYQGRRTRAFFSKSNTKLINSHSNFNKWTMYKILKNNKNIASHLPITILYRTNNDLIEALKKSKTIYVKSTTGQRGKRVVRISQLSDGKYQYSCFNNKLFIGRTNNIKQLVSAIRTLIGNRQMIIQSAIDLVTINNDLIDFRAEVQRNGQGEIEIVGICARRGSSHSPITTHANSFRFEHFFKKHLKYNDIKIANLKKKIIPLLLEVYQTFENAYGPFGEIGIDFGIDKNSKIWIIEGNTLTAKVSLYKAYDEDTIQRVFLNPLEYAKFLSRGAV